MITYQRMIIYIFSFNLVLCIKICNINKYSTMYCVIVATFSSMKILKTNNNIAHMPIMFLIHY